MADKYVLKSLHLNGVLSLRQVKISCDFLSVISTSWDFELRIFCFGKRKLRPLVEEFSANISFRLYSPHVLPCIPRDLPCQCSHVLGLSKKDVATTLFWDEVDFMASISYLQKNRRTLYGIFRNRATVFRLLRAFLFVGGSAYRGMRCFECGGRRRCDQTPMLLVVAKTILCLGHIHHHPNQFFSSIAAVGGLQARPGSISALPICFFLPIPFFSLFFVSLGRRT